MFKRQMRARLGNACYNIVTVKGVEYMMKHLSKLLARVHTAIVKFSSCVVGPE